MNLQNHVDVESINWLEDYPNVLRHIVVSHDRHFLNRAVPTFAILITGKLTSMLETMSFGMKQAN